ncbi:hypothetical protein SAMD00023353_0902810 [Rosellinia necatrix]|uniref:Uncharacterized protein n=1 Tax=Rosellinia necatrix TaxID=77044 RepID=A0A1W2TL93_ROSNE|nr:hypothetical protein SAMD00023353_0902810 [Rosellinia necatrix]
MHFTNSTSNSTAAFAYCPPVAAQPLYTTVYETVLLAACETGSWMATYTVSETCTGDKTNYVAPTMPPGFVVTTVHCHSCPESEIEITCPGAQPTGTGKPTVHISGNGVTATVTAWPVPTPTHGGVPYPTKGAGSPGNGGATNGGSGGGSGSGGCHSGHCGAGAVSGVGKNVTVGAIGKPPTVVTGAAVSVRKSLITITGLIFIAGHFVWL